MNKRNRIPRKTNVHVVNLNLMVGHAILYEYKVFEKVSP